MCGIAGFAGSGNQLDLAAMVGQLEHRGPDDVGFRSEQDLARPVHLGFQGSQEDEVKSLDRLDG